MAPDLMMALIQTLDAYYAGEPMVYVSGNLLVFYEPGNRREHLSPGRVRGQGRGEAPAAELLDLGGGKGPDVVIELTSRLNGEEDIEDKYELYQDTLRVSEYFLFDPLGDVHAAALAGLSSAPGRL